ncbi:SipW-dependent-type signal peptide-containing protein [Subtercola endophyticus]|uniref:SipW-dependent-type signal peptide-containing protein n=1 Tax=Subtercola endophyticus TaxID=2895559 RepID=UPI001E45308E|nr:SipW-dependent-type signal peptide-containing protein [Subtercola endophyticus]UFS58071.1 CalY family protein [Subtercola endophyticus]
MARSARTAGSVPRTFAFAAITAGAIVVAAVLGAGGTFALWNSSANASGPVSVQSGTAALSVSSALAMSTARLYPGGTVTGAVTLANTGNTPLALRVTGLSAGTPATAFSSALTIGVGPGTAAACTAGTVTPTWTGTAATWAAGSLATTVAAGSSAPLCVSIALATSADNTAQNLSATVIVTIDGTQP